MCHSKISHDIAPAGFCPYPFVAMVLEGDDAISKVHQLTSETERFPFRSPAKDCELWFCARSADDWIEEATKSNHLACAHLIQNIWLTRYFAKEAFYNNFYHEDLTFFLIRPLAFQKRCVGLLLSIIENIGFGIMGMDLVTKSEVPASDAWPADSCSSPEIDGYGVALLVECINP
ncbi:hypothetical protein MKW92_012591 [Papaver armeniacum]|nr:hypothetical protein MKW92_012591 [Papaver armeniacum]